MSKFVYYDGIDYYFKEIEEQYIETADKFKEYFGYIDDHLGDDGEMIIYKLTPHKVFKKDVTYKFKEE